MKNSEYSKMYEAEQTYFWFVSKRRTLTRLLSNILGRGDRLILDMGCGTGSNLEGLKAFGEAYGIDASATALDFCEKRGMKLLVRGTCESIPFKSGSFDLVSALDLLEHLSDDDSALMEACRVTRPGGFLLVTVPAYQLLFGAHDYALGHKRRYNKKDLESKIKAAGFQTARASYYMSLILPATLILKLYQKLFGSHTDTITYRVHPFLNRLFLFLCELEARMLVHINMPAGTSIVMLARKPEGAV